MFSEFIRKFYLILFFLIAIGAKGELFGSTFFNSYDNYSTIQNRDFSNESLINKDVFFAENEISENTISEISLTKNINIAYFQQDNNLEFEDDPTEELPLLPQNISLVEKFFWGKDGLFRSVGITSELTPEQRQKELEWRRTFLTIHQTTGLVSWGLMAGAVIAGQMWLDGKMDSPTWHKRLLYATIGTYSLTGLLAIVTPPPFERRNEFSSISFHKLAAWLHIAGMIATPILGKAINESNDYYKSARIHQTMGYITFSVYSAAMLAIIIFE